MNLKEAQNHPHIHGYHNRVFKLSKDITNSTLPSKMLNAKLINEDIYSFSFVRHPYTRYLGQYILMKFICLKILYFYQIFVN